MSFRLINCTRESVATVDETENQTLKDELLQEVQQKLNEGDYAESLRLREEAAIIVENKAAGITYKNVLDKVDLKYQISGQKLKETILLSEPVEQDVFSFSLHYEGLVPAVQEFGSVYFYEEGQVDKEPVFIIEAPYMEDSSQEDTLNTDIEVTVQATSYGCIYSLKPNKEWLNSPERVYPIMIDPTVTTSTSASDIEDNHVNQSDPGTNYMTTNRMYVGSNLSGTTAYESRAYIRFPRVSGITSSSLIASAKMYLNHYPTSSWQSADNLTINVYDVGNYNWDSKTLTWNTQKNYVFSNLIFSRKTDKSYSEESFDITSLVRKWYTASSDNGLVIKPGSLDRSKTNRTCYFSSDCDYSYANKRPRISITYYDPATISNGYYFIRNRSTDRYIDIEGPSTASGAKIQQWDFHGDVQSQWQLTKQSDGYYTIKSIFSNLYISATGNSSVSGAGITQVSNASASGARWRIYQISGAYVFISKSSNSCALSVPTSANDNGTDLVQTAYTSDSNYRDEWYIGRFIPDVPAEIISNDDHLCIPTAITIIASYWGRHGYSGFGGLTTAQMETAGKKVAAAMRAAGSDAANVYTPYGLAVFSHKSGSTTYKLTSTVREPADWSALQTEINAGRPLMLGFARKEYDGGHMTVCVGFEQCGGTQRVYLADGWTTGKYVLKPFNTTENDYMRAVRVTQS